jgi:hypothetical protein
MNLFAAAPSLLDDSPNGNQLLSAQLLFSIRLRLRALNFLVARLCNLDCHVKWKNAGLNRRNQPFLAIRKKSADHADIIAAYTDFRCDFVIVVTAASQGTDVLQ